MHLLGFEKNHNICNLADFNLDIISQGDLSDQMLILLTHKYARTLVGKPSAVNLQFTAYIPCQVTVEEDLQGLSS